MKHITPLLVFLGALAAEASAQIEGYEAEPEMTNESVKIRYFAKNDRSEAAGAALKGALEKLGTIKSVFISSGEKTASFTFEGGYMELQKKAEKAGQNAGVPVILLSHAHVPLALGLKPGAKPADLQSTLEAVPGVKHYGGGTMTKADVFADLEALDFDSLIGALDRAGFQAQALRHERIRITAEGEGMDAFLAALQESPVTAAARAGDGGVVVIALKGLGNGTIEKFAEKSKVKVKKIERL